MGEGVPGGGGGGERMYKRSSERTDFFSGGTDRGTATKRKRSDNEIP